MKIGHHLSISHQRFECARCGTVHHFVSELSGPDFIRRSQIFIEMHQDCIGRLVQELLPFRPAMPPSEPNITC